MVGGIQPVEPQGIEFVALLVGLYPREKRLVVRRHLDDAVVVVGERLGVLLQFPRGAALGLVERLALALQRRHLLLQPRFVEQVRVAG